MILILLNLVRLVLRLKIWPILVYDLWVLEKNSVNANLMADGTAEFFNTFADLPSRSSNW